MIVKKEYFMMNRFMWAMIPLALASITSAAPQTQKQPNILLIVADDLGYSDIEPFGWEIPTPNLKKLAQNGTTLTDFHAGPTCSVTRSMLLTGNDHHQAGLGTMAEYLQPEQIGKAGYEGKLNRRVMTLPEVLKNNGYKTYMTGKWHLGGGEDSLPNARGFDKSFILVPGGADHFKQIALFPNYPAKYKEDGKDASLPDNFYSTDFYTDKLLSYLKDDRKKGEPFFAYVAYTSPHWPLQAPDAYLKKYQGKYEDGYDVVRQQRLKKQIELGIVPANTQINNPFKDKFPAWDKLTPWQKADQAKTMQVYAAMIDNLDHNIGRIFKHLEENGELDNTIVLFISDNGAESSTPESLGTTAHKNGIRKWVDETFDNSLENMGKDNSYVALGPQWAQVSSTPYPYFKSYLANGGIRVPAIIQYPNQKKKANLNHDLAHVIDFVPTMLDLANIQRPKTNQGETLLAMEGRSILPTLQGKKQPERGIGWEFNTRRAYYQGDWAVQMQAPPYGTGQWELYNRKNDPSFLHNLALSNTKQTEKMAKAWDQYAKHVGVVYAPVRYKYGQMNCFYDTCVQPEFLKNQTD